MTKARFHRHVIKRLIFEIREIDVYMSRKGSVLLDWTWEDGEGVFGELQQTSGTYTFIRVHPRSSWVIASQPVSESRYMARLRAIGADLGTGH